MSKLLLVVEDSPDDVFFLERACKRANVGFVTHWAKNVDEAIQYMKGDGVYRDRTKFPLPDVILLDLRMPGKDGFAFLEWRKQHYQWLSVPVITFTSSKLAEDMRRAYNLGSNSFISKPLADARLSQIVASLEEWWMKLNQAPQRDEETPPPAPEKGE